MGLCCIRSPFSAIRRAGKDYKLGRSIRRRQPFPPRPDENHGDKPPSVEDDGDEKLAEKAAAAAEAEKDQLDDDEDLVDSFEECADSYLEWYQARLERGKDVRDDRFALSFKKIVATSVLLHETCRELDREYGTAEDVGEEAEMAVEETGEKHAGETADELEESQPRSGVTVTEEVQERHAPAAADGGRTNEDRPRKCSSSRYVEMHDQRYRELYAQLSEAHPEPVARIMAVADAQAYIRRVEQEDRLRHPGAESAPSLAEQERRRARRAEREALRAERDARAARRSEEQSGHDGGERCAGSEKTPSAPRGAGGVEGMRETGWGHDAWR